MISEGIKSGVNLTRLKSSPKVLEMVFTNRVFASPGTPINKQLPFEKIEIST